VENQASGDQHQLPASATGRKPEQVSQQQERYKYRASEEHRGIGGSLKQELFIRGVGFSPFFPDKV
jgi:hypothetical protein